MVGCLACALMFHQRASGGDPENAACAVFVRVFRISVGHAIAFQLRVMLLERIRNVLQEDEAEDACLYSAVSMLPRSASAMRQSSAS